MQIFGFAFFIIILLFNSVVATASAKSYAGENNSNMSHINMIIVSDMLCDDMQDNKYLSKL